jgi:hypothetical protein
MPHHVKRSDLRLPGVLDSSLCILVTGCVGIPRAQDAEMNE